VSEKLLRVWLTVLARVEPVESGQTTAEYALVMLAAAAIAGMVLAWATKSHTISRLFDAVIDKLVP
jgi:ABC-type sulfate transport system permease component